MYSAQFGGRAGRSKGKAPKKTKKKRKQEKQAAQQQQQQQQQQQAGGGVAGARGAKPSGGGSNHKTSRKAGGAVGNSGGGGNGSSKPGGPVTLTLPDGFRSRGDDDDDDGSDTDGRPTNLLFDSGADLSATLDKLENGGKKTTKKLLAALDNLDITPDDYGGCVCRMFLKPSRPFDSSAARIQALLGLDPCASFVVGLSPSFDMMVFVDSDADDDDDAGGNRDDRDGNAGTAEEDDAEEVEFLIGEGRDALLAAVDASQDSDANKVTVVGVCASLDYTAKVVKSRPGMDRVFQLRRLRAACRAAVSRDVPVQIRVAPGPDEGDGADAGSGADGAGDGEEEDTVPPDVQVVRDVVKVLLDETPPATDGRRLRVHLSCWRGKADHALKLLGAFPTSLWIGLDASVGFAKASEHRKNCAFEIPLGRLLLETGSAVPAPVAAALGKGAFCHPSMVPFVAAAVARHKPSGTTALEVARAASANAVEVYGSALAERAARARELASGAKSNSNASRGGKSNKKKQKKRKKGKKGQRNQHQGATQPCSPATSTAVVGDAAGRDAIDGAAAGLDDFDAAFFAAEEAEEAAAVAADAADAAVDDDSDGGDAAALPSAPATTAAVEGEREGEEGCRIA